MLGKGTDLSDDFLQVRITGDMAFFQALSALVLEAEDRSPGRVLDHGLHRRRIPTASRSTASTWPRSTGTRSTSHRPDPRADRARRRPFVDAERTIVCWAMGLTQHKARRADDPGDRQSRCCCRGNIGRPAPASARSAATPTCRATARWASGRRCRTPSWTSSATSSASSRREHGLRHRGHDPRHARRRRQGLLRHGRQLRLGDARHRGRPTAALAVAGPHRPGLDQAEPLAHITGGRRSSCRASGAPSATAGGRRAVRDGRGLDGHGARDPWPPRARLAAPAKRARDRRRPRATAVPRRRAVDWAGLASDYDVIRDRIERVVPGFEDFNGRVREPGGFPLPHPPRDERRFTTDERQGRVHRLSTADGRTCRPGHLLLQTVRSHDQFNTTIYGLDDRYRGITTAAGSSSCNPDDLAELGLHDGDMVDMVGEWKDGLERRAERLPDRRLRHGTRLRCCVLPRGECARPARFGRGHVQYADVQEHRHPTREGS